jgi:SAM-dependent methyltransferase
MDSHFAQLDMGVPAGRMPVSNPSQAHGCIELPERKTVRRWIALVRSGLSLTRALEYEALDGLALEGRVLDLGGDRRSRYHQLIAVTGNIETVNINPIARPDHVLDLEQPLPFEDETFDHVISANTLEHIQRDEQLLSEVVRILRDGGSFHILVPFCHRVHGSPRDYHRHTAEWWLNTMLSHQCGMVRVRPLVWDRFSSAAAFISFGRIFRALAMALPDPRMLLSAMRRTRRTGKSVNELVRLRRADFALGYYVSGIRRKHTKTVESGTCR